MPATLGLSLFMTRILASLILLGVSVVGALLFDTGIGALHTEVPGFADPSAPCEPTEPRLAASRGSIDKNSAVLYNNGYIRFQVCDLGTLRFLARGTAAAGSGAHLLVSIGGEALWEGEILGQQSLEVSVERTGWLTLAFLNDLSLGDEDRNLWIHELDYVVRR